MEALINSVHRKGHQHPAAAATITIIKMIINHIATIIIIIIIIILTHITFTAISKMYGIVL